MPNRSLTGLVLKRLASGLVTLFLVSLMVFAGTEILPGDVAQAILGQQATPESVQILRDKLGLDRPAPVRIRERRGRSGNGVHPATGLDTAALRRGGHSAV